MRSLRRQLAWAAAGAAIGCLVLGVSLAALSAKEQDNRFCVSCHLHEQKLDRLSASPPHDLAGLHFQRDGRIGCIACHGGVGPARRLRVWTLAALDTARFFVHAYEEPKQMRIPIPDRECRRCHSPILKPGAAGARGSTVRAPGARMPAPVDPSDESTFAEEAATEGRRGTSYHALRDHDGVNVRCVRCHTSHTTDSDSASRFISRATVQPVCRECHKQM